MNELVTALTEAAAPFILNPPDDERDGELARAVVAILCSDDELSWRDVSDYAAILRMQVAFTCIDHRVHHFGLRVTGRDELASALSTAWTAEVLRLERRARRVDAASWPMTSDDDEGPDDEIPFGLTPERVRELLVDQVRDDAQYHVGLARAEP